MGRKFISFLNQYQGNIPFLYPMKRGYRKWTLVWNELRVVLEIKKLGFFSSYICYISLISAILQQSHSPYFFQQLGPSKSNFCGSKALRDLEVEYVVTLLFWMNKLNLFQFLLNITLIPSMAYLEPSRTSTMKLFCESS